MAFNLGTTNGFSPSKGYPKTSVESQMSRTFYPKYASYTGDGSGRDSYVILNNGGLTNCDKRYMMFRKSSSPQ